MIRTTERGRLALPSLDHIATLCGVMIALGTLPLAVLGQRHAAMAKAQAWTVAGPPCPLISRRNYMAFGAPASDTFSFGGARIARAYGYAKCGMVTNDRIFGLGLSPVCQFNSPTVLEITTPAGRFFFMTGMRPATVLLIRGKPECVLGAKLDFDWLRE